MVHVAVDSRAVKPNDLFIALTGAQTDGHNFLHDAKAKGARAAIIRSDYTGPIPEGLEITRVPDTLVALQNMAKERIEKSSGKIIAITGSVGKTTTKEFIRTLAAAKWKTFATEGNQNSQVGLSQTIVNNIKGDEEVLIVEMGMTDRGHIKKLLQIAPPDIALVTQIALMHPVLFEDGLEGIANAKSEIFSHPKTKLGLINLDTEYTDLLFQTGSFPKKSFSSKGKAKADLLLEISEKNLIFTEMGKRIEVPKPNFPVRHVYDNLLAAVMAVRALDMPWNILSDAISKLKLPERRLELIRKGSIDCINDSYNAGEMSMKSALDYLATFKPRRRVAVLGQMRELGRYSAECHEKVGLHALNCADMLLCLGEECGPLVEVWKKAKRPVEWAMTFPELESIVAKKVEKDDVLLLKGSRSNGMWRVLDIIKDTI